MFFVDIMIKSMYNINISKRKGETYFLKEYTIYIRQGNATPYTLKTYKTIDGAKFDLYNMVAIEKERLRPYYVDNDFYDNEYSMVGNIKYMRILEREVTEWTCYKNHHLKNDNKIIFYNNF